MRYKIGERVQRDKGSIKKYIVSVVASMVMVGGAAIPALAVNGGGGYCVNSSNGCESAAAAGAQCDTGAGSGAFGAFGEHGDVTHDFRGGANGQQTGLNNSALCGNRQGNL
jgi:hypothetical protein